MKSIKTLSILFLFILLVSCEMIAMHPHPSEDNRSIFDEYAKICIEKYGLADVNGVNLTELADSIRPFIHSGLGEEELFNYMAILTTRMREGHTNLKAIDEGYRISYNWFWGYPAAINPSIPLRYYYGASVNPDVQSIVSEDTFYKILYGFLPQDNEIGYIRITSFQLKITTAEIETMMDYLKGTKGIIIDVRGNLGGYVEIASRLASFFTKEKVTFATNYIKNGPDPNDFAASKMILNPSGSASTYVKNIAVLHDRFTFSSGSQFVVRMSALDNVVTIGQKFGGGTGQIIDGILANGWVYRVSASNLEDNQGRPSDPGIDADIPMVIDPSDRRTDDIIERAIIELQ